MKKINLEEEVKKSLNTSIDESLINEAKAILDNSYEKELELDRKHLEIVGLNRALIEHEKLKNIAKLQLKYDHQLVHISQIGKICSKYSLSFRPSKEYKGQVCAELGSKITKFVKDYNITIEYYKTFIMAPNKLFDKRVEDLDPLFFIHIDNDYYYMIHQWGSDLHWSRKLLKWIRPLLSLKFLIVTTFLLSFGLPVYFGMIFSIMILLIILGIISSFAMYSNNVNNFTDNLIKDIRRIFKRTVYD